MIRKTKKTLIVGPSKDTKGGITSVIFAYKNSEFWEKWDCVWIPSYIDKNWFLKIVFFLSGYIKFLLFLPTTKIVHIHIALGTSAFRKKFFFYLAYYLRKKTILHFHTPGNAKEPPIDLPIILKIFNKANAVIVLSDGWKDLVIKYCPKAKVYTVPNPAPPIKKIDKNKMDWILFMGTLDYRKGFLDLLKAFSLIHKDFPEWKLIFAGNGMIEKGRTVAEELKITNKVEFKGWVKGKQKAYLFKMSSIFCLPSYAEGFPVSILEALSYGLPIVCSPVGGIKDFLNEEIDFISCSPGNCKDIAMKLSLLMKNKKLQFKMARNSLKIANDKFSMEEISKQMSNIYIKISN